MFSVEHKKKNKNKFKQIDCKTKNVVQCHLRIFFFCCSLKCKFRQKKQKIKQTKKLFVFILTFSAELKTTTSPGGCIHGSPSTCTGISE